MLLRPGTRLLFFLLPLFAAEGLVIHPRVLSSKRRRVVTLEYRRRLKFYQKFRIYESWYANQVFFKVSGSSRRENHHLRNADYEDPSDVTQTQCPTGVASLFPNVRTINTTTLETSMMVFYNDGIHLLNARVRTRSFDLGGFCVPPPLLVDSLFYFHICAALCRI